MAVFALSPAMSTFLYTLLGLTVGSSLHCPERREISPCSCRVHEPYSDTTVVACERMSSFRAVADALRGKFSPDAEIVLKVSHSRLVDLDNYTFHDLGFVITKLKLNHDDLSNVIDEGVFAGLSRLEYLSLADNVLGAVPRNVLRQMPHVKTLDLSRSQLQAIAADDFKDTPELHGLVLGSNDIAEMEQHSLPSTLRQLHLARNRISDLNSTLRDLTSLVWLFLNENQLRSLEEQLPRAGPSLNLLHAANNQLQRLPQELRNFPRLESLFVHYNELDQLGGALQRLRNLKHLHLYHNKITELSADEFLELELLEDLKLENNRLRSLNNSLLPLRSLKYLNLSNNQLTEFSLQEIRGLKNIRVLDLSYNSISQLGGQMENLVESETRVFDLRLEHNNIHSLSGSLMGLHGLWRLSLSHNGLQEITPDDLIGLDDLRFLDISHNHLTTLEETSRTFLPSLERLIANNNFLTTLGKDFHGLPALCYADLSNNMIEVVGPELASKTHCNILGVPGKLTVELQGNPVFCTPALATMMRAMNNTKLLGVTCPAVEVIGVE